MKNDCLIEFDLSCPSNLLDRLIFWYCYCILKDHSLPMRPSNKDIYLNKQLILIFRLGSTRKGASSRSVSLTTRLISESTRFRMGVDQVGVGITLDNCHPQSVSTHILFWSMSRKATRCSNWTHGNR